MEYFTHICTTRKWRSERVTRVKTCAILLCLSIIISTSYCDSGTDMSCANVKTNNGQIVMSAKLTINDNNLNEEPKHFLGSYAISNSRINKDPLHGVLVRVRTKNNGSELGCSEIDPSIIPVNQKWIALVKRGTCAFHEKIFMAAKRPNASNASAVLIYNDKETDQKCLALDVDGEKNLSDVVTVYIPLNVGRDLLSYMNSTADPVVTISRLPDKSKPTTPPDHSNPISANNTSVLFVSISFIVLIIISLAWLVFYYIQRCRYTNAKERLGRRLTNAAKKAIAKIPQRTVKFGDKELDADADQCAVCIEPYKVTDVIRVLPCKHMFHKSCVDPWLLEQRSCPMCKMDILRAFGMHLNGSQESVPQDAESGIMSSTPAIDDTEHLSNSEEQGAVGGVKIVLYHPTVRTSLRYKKSGGGGSSQFVDSEMSSEGSLDLGSSPMAECHMDLTAPTTAQCYLDCTNQVVLEKENTLNDVPSLARSVSLDSVHSSEDECNEIRSLITRGSGAGGGSRSRHTSSSSSSITLSIKDSMLMEH